MLNLPKSKIRSLFNTLGENPVLFLLLFAVFTLCRAHLQWTSLFLCLLFWYLRTRDHSFWVVLGLLMISCIPLYQSTYPTMSQGRAAVVKENYAVLAEGRQRILVYTDHALELDATYTVSGKFQKVDSAKGFFRFDTLSWAHSMGAYYSTDEKQVHLIQENFTLRHCLQKRIETVQDQETRENLNRILLNIKQSSENSQDDFLNEHGFSYAGILAVLNAILKYFIGPKKRRYLMGIINLCLIILYHAPMLLVQSFLFRILSATHMDSAQKASAGLSCILMLYPGCLLTLSFLIPAVYRLSFLFPQKGKKISFFLLLCLQSIFLHHVNPLEMMMYPVNIGWVGVLWVCGLLSFFFPFIPFDSLCQLLNKINSFYSTLTLYGSMLGFGLLFFLFFCWSFRRNKFAVEIWIALFFIFLASGMFHPLAEVTTINVGQGDSILIREPFQMQNILIDTGKPSQWRAVNDYLHSKGINRLDTLVITHPDNDHSGNEEQIIADYHPSQVITAHQKQIVSGKYVLYDLNQIQNEDENESCLVLAGRINGLSYLFMGDADSTTEEKLISEYDKLHCDILKLSHHGSKTGSSTPFLDVIRPQIGLISSGAYEIYHHPSPETIQQLLKRHIEFFDTKEAGDISIVSFFGLNFLITADGNIGIILA